MKQTLIRIYAVLLGAIFAIVFTAQILGFLGVYRAILAVPLTLIVAVCATIAYLRFGEKYFETLSPQASKSALLRWTILFVCIFIVLIIFVQRMLLWHGSTLGEIISADFAGYHSIKALQLLREGSIWNLAIPYGQYPFGYESLISFGMFFINDIRITGTMHALIFVLFWLTIALLILRYSQLPIDLSLLAALALCFMPIIFPHILNMGKNDIFLSLTVLMAILHAPVGDEQFHPLGLAFATMLSLATKATGLYILFYLWGLVMLFWGIHWSKQTWRDYLHPLTFVLVIMLMFPGGLWVIRNFLVLGELFTSEISSFFQTSIFANLDNPYLFNSRGSTMLVLAGLLLLVFVIMSFFHKGLRWQMSGTLLIIALTFAVTPLSAFLTVNNLDYLDVQWRFVLHGIILLWVLGLVLLAPVMRSLYTWLEKHSALIPVAVVALFFACIGLLLALGLDDVFSYDADQWDSMINPTLQDGSIYDEMASLEAGTIYIENISWLSPSIRNPDLTITELRYPLGHADIYPMPDVDYIAIAFTSPREPHVSIYDPDAWEMIFEHETGRIYQRLP